MPIANDITELIGNTPLVYLNSVTRDCVGRVAVKLESMEPCSSVKDRIGISMLSAAEEEGIVQAGITHLIEPTSGNTGVSLACVAAVKGYDLTLVMPARMSMERRMVLKAFGANLVITEPAYRFEEVLAKAEDIAAKTAHGHVLKQFKNPNNPRIHYETTGPEIWRDTDGQIDAFVAGVGTGGTLTGTGKYLKEQKPNLLIAAVEPAESPVLSGGNRGSHSIQGIGAGIVPENLDTEIYNEVIQVSSEEAVHMSRRLALEEGLCVGISAGAAVMASLRIAKRPHMSQKLIVCIIPSFGERYLSTLLFEDIRNEVTGMRFQ